MRYIDQTKIYDQTEQGLTIFDHYFPGEDFKNPKKYIKQRSEEKTASTRITMYGGYWRITDFGKQDQVNGMKAIDYVMYHETLPYYDALKWIEQVVIGRTIEADKFQKSKWQAEYSTRDVTKEDKKKDYNFTFKDHPSPSDLESLGRYVEEKDLDYFYCKSVEKYEYVGENKAKTKDIVHIFTATKDFPMFVFDYGDFKKIYKPHEQDKKYRFLYVGTKPKNYIYGLAQIKKIPNEFTINPDEEEKNDGIKLPEGKPLARVKDLFRVSGESDAINMHSVGFNVYWLNSETAEFSHSDFKEVDQLTDNHYQVMDLDPTGHEQAIKNALKHINLFTIQLPDWLKFKKDFRNNPCKDLKDFINLCGTHQEDTKYNMSVLKNDSRRIKFWSKYIDPSTKKAVYSFNMEDFIFFLRSNGFYTMESLYHKGASYCYCRIVNKVVELIDPADIKRIIKRFTLDWLMSKQLLDRKEICNKVRTSNQLSESNMESLDRINLEFKNYDQDTEYIHFRNNSIKIQKDKISMLKNEEVPNHILGKLIVNKEIVTHIIDRNVRLIEKPPIEINATPEYQILLTALEATKTPEERNDVNILITNMADIDKYQVTFNDEEFIFTHFMKDISHLHWRKELEKKETLTDDQKKEQTLCLANLMFIIGYHCTQFKDPTKAWMTFLQDMKLSEVGKSSGGSGKSLLGLAPTYVRSSFTRDGKRINDKNYIQFFYDGLTEFHDYIQIDDLVEHADMTFLYPQISSSRDVNPKNYSAMTLKYKDSGKMLISSNFELMNVDSSTMRRLLNGGCSDFYHENTKFNDYQETRSPFTKLGRRLYDDFTDEEWIKFYNFIAYCIQLQMRFYKIQPPMEDLNKRQLRREMAKGLGNDEEFFKWAGDYFAMPPAGDTSNPAPADQGYLNRYINKKLAYDNFCESYLNREQVMKYKIEKFKKHVQLFCEYKQYEFNPQQYLTNLEEKRIMRKIDLKLVELFYISTINTNPSDQPLAEPNPEPSQNIDFNLPDPDNAPF